MIVKILSVVGLVLGVLGVSLTIRKVLMNTYETKEMFDYFKENRALFSHVDRAVLHLGRWFFSERLGREARIPSHIRTLKEGNEVVIGFVMILLGFTAQIVVALLSFCGE